MGKVALNMESPLIGRRGDMIDIGLVFNYGKFLKGKLIQIDSLIALIEYIKPFPDYRSTVVDLIM